MLMPSKVKYRKQQRGRMRGKAYRGSTLAFGDVGLQILVPGFRGPDHPAKHPLLVRVAVVGDSTVFGFGVRYGDSFVGRLATLLRRRFPAADADVVNAGCYGYTSFQKLQPPSTRPS